MENYFLEEHENLTTAKLKEAKPLIKLFGFDYDGTISDGVNYKQPQVFDLTEKILAKDKSIAFVTARAATALRILVPPLLNLLTRRETTGSCFIAGGNGATLYEIKKDGPVEIYNHGFKLPQVLHAVAARKRVYEKLKIKKSDLAEKGLITFRDFLKENWDSFIPAEIIDICRPFDGELFTEEAKVTFVLPKNKTLHKKIVTELNEELGKGYCAVAGDDTYVHITRKLEEDGKIVAIKTVLKLLSLKQNQVATFGDMPTGNDAGLLSFPYSFTNSEKFARVKHNLQKPPYVLVEPGLSPVARVYKAVEYLIS